MKSVVVVVALFFIAICGCASRNSVNKVQTYWNYPPEAKIRILGGAALNFKKVSIESKIPSEIALEVNSIDYPYFVEILTKDQRRLFGTLLVIEATKLTELTNVKIELTQAIIEKVLDNQVSQIAVNDPSAGKKILEFNIGNKMPPAMNELYNNGKIKLLE